jgi:hypothetical protein
MSSNHSKQTPITKFTCPHKSYSSATKVEDELATEVAVTVAMPSMCSSPSNIQTTKVKDQTNEVDETTSSLATTDMCLL